MSNGAWIVVGAAVGGLVGFIGAAIERRARGLSDFAGTAAKWLAATDAMGLLADQDVSYSEKPTNKVGLLLDWLADQLEATIGKGRAELLRALVHRPLIRRAEAIYDRAMEATALLILQAPLNVLRELQPHLENFSAWMRAPADQDARRRWQEESRPVVTAILRRATRPGWRRLG